MVFTKATNDVTYIVYLVQSSILSMLVTIACHGEQLWRDVTLFFALHHLHSVMACSVHCKYPCWLRTHLGISSTYSGRVSAKFDILYDRPACSSIIMLEIFTDPLPPVQLNFFYTRPSVHITVHYLQGAYFPSVSKNSLKHPVKDCLTYCLHIFVALTCGSLLKGK